MSRERSFILSPAWATNKRLRETKEALYIEREKLITHLQTSREGLGVFTKDKKEILVNNLFTQYGNFCLLYTSPGRQTT